MRGLSSIAALTGVALLSGCAVGPNFRRPAPPAVSGYMAQPLPATTAAAQVAGGEAQRLVQGLDLPLQWWTLFESPALNALIEQALRENPSLVSAQAALRQAHELVWAQQGFFFPTLTASFTPSRQKVSQILSNPLADPTLFTFNLYTAQVAVGYSPDVFGGNRRQVESLRGLADAQRFLLEATYVTLTSNVVSAAVQEASLRAQIAAQQEIIAIVTKSLELLRKQFDLGYVARLDVAAQESALALVQQALPPLQKQLEITRDQLTALVGRLPSEAPAETFELAALQLPQTLPLSLPSQLVEHRPDVRAAEEQLHAASGQIGVAVAARLPQFTINAAVGGESAEITQMFKAANVFWTVAGTVSQTLFAGGTLLHRQRAAEAAFEQAAATYRTTVVAAFQNVADTLHALRSDAVALQAAVAAEQAAKLTLDLTLKQQQLGYANYLALLSAQQAYQAALVTRVQAQAARLADTAALFQALGGGWWNRPEPGR